MATHFMEEIAKIRPFLSALYAKKQQDGDRLLAYVQGSEVSKMKLAVGQLNPVEREMVGICERSGRRIWVFYMMYYFFGLHFPKKWTQK